MITATSPRDTRSRDIDTAAPTFRDGNTLAVRANADGTVHIPGNAATDANGGTLNYRLVGPANIGIDANTGEITGRTNMQQGSTCQLWRTATNSAGQQTTQVITLAVAR